MTDILLCIISIFLTTAPNFAQQTPPQDTPQPAQNTAQDLTPEQRGKLEKLARLQKNFGKSMNSPGVDLTLKEVSRSRSADRTLVTYELHATGVPTNSIFTLYQVQIDGSIIKNLEGVTIDSKGIAVCAGREGTCQGNGPNDPIDLIVFAGRGEPKRFALVSDDDTHLKAFAGTVPFPNSTTDKNCELESVIATPKGELTFVQGTGFEPNEELTIDSESYDEKHHDVAKAEGDGSYFSAVMPYVSGKKSGKTVWQVKAKNCHPKLTFTWGAYELQ